MNREADKCGLHYCKRYKDPDESQTQDPRWNNASNLREKAIRVVEKLGRNRTCLPGYYDENGEWFAGKDPLENE